MTASCQYRRPVPDWSSREAGVTGDQAHSRSVPGFDSPDRLNERRFQNAFADGPEYKAKYPSLQILAVADDDQINDGCAVRLSRERLRTARQFQLRMETNSVITQPSGMMEIRPGYNRITGLAWSGHGKIAKVKVSTDGAKSWKQAQLNEPVLPKAQTRFQLDWAWDGKPTKIVSRSTDDKGNVQPDRQSFIAAMGTNALFHYNALQTWSIDEAGRVRNVLA